MSPPRAPRTGDLIGWSLALFCLGCAAAAVAESVRLFVAAWHAGDAFLRF